MIVTTSKAITRCELSLRIFSYFIRRIQRMVANKSFFFQTRDNFIYV